MGEKSGPDNENSTVMTANGGLKCDKDSDVTSAVQVTQSESSETAIDVYKQVDHSKLEHQDQSEEVLTLKSKIDDLATRSASQDLEFASLAIQSTKVMRLVKRLHKVKNEAVAEAKDRSSESSSSDSDDQIEPDKRNFEFYANLDVKMRKAFLECEKTIRDLKAQLVKVKTVNQKKIRDINQNHAKEVEQLKSLNTALSQRYAHRVNLCKELRDDRFDAVSSLNPDEYESQFMEIFVMTLAGNTITLQVKPTYTIGEVKEMIEETEGILPDKQRLTFKGEQLENDQHLADYGILKESILYCT